HYYYLLLFSRSVLFLYSLYSFSSLSCFLNLLYVFFFFFFFLFFFFFFFFCIFYFFFSSRRRHTRSTRDWSSDVCSSDLLEPVAHGGEGRRGARLQRVELVLCGQLAVLVGGKLEGLGQEDDPYVMEEERALGELRVCVPLRGLDGVGASERIVVVPVLHVRLGEDSHAAELARLPGAVSGGEHDLRGDQGSGSAERRLPGDVHD